MGRTLIAVVGAAAAVVAAAAAQDVSRPAYRVGSELVVVDLLATDRSGSLAADLQPSEIRIFEDGKPQKIRFVTLVGGGIAARTGAEAAAAAGPPAAAPAPPGTAAAPAEATALAIVLDLASMPADAMPRVRDAIRQMLREQVPSHVSVMLATIDHGLSVKQPFTTDRPAVLAALDAIPLAAGAHLSLAEMLDKADHSCDANPAAPGSGSLEPIQSVISQGVTLGKALIAETRVRIASASQSLTALSRSLAALPGRKHVVFYSAGYPLNPVDDVIEAVSAGAAACLGMDPAASGAANLRRLVSQDLVSMRSVDSITQLQDAIDRANRAQVSFYSVDPRGLVTTNLQAQQRGSARLARRGVIQKVAALDQTASQAYLAAVAAGTGGTAYLNTNDLTRGLRRAWMDASEYYLIGYTPSGSRKKGQFRKIEVKIARPDLDLRYRRGYYQATDQELAQKDIESALRDPSSFMQDGFDVEARVEDGKLWVTTFIPASAIRFTADDAAQKADFSLHGTMRDAQGKLVGGKAAIGRDLGVRLNAERVAELLDSGSKLEIRTDLTPPPQGKYQIVVVARDSGGWIAARAIDVVVP